MEKKVDVNLCLHDQLDEKEDKLKETQNGLKLVTQQNVNLQKQLEETQKSLKLVTQQKSSLNNQLKRRRSHLHPVLPLHINEQAVIPRALYRKMSFCWKLYGDYRNVGCCAVVFVCFLFRRSLDLLPVDDFFQFIGEHQEWFRIMEDKLLLIEDFDKCMARMEDILDLIMSPFMIGQNWLSTFEKIRHHVQGSGDENDQWFMVYIPSTPASWRHMTPTGNGTVRMLPGHVFICCATRKSVTFHPQWAGWSYTLYDQKKTEPISPWGPWEYDDDNVNCWKIVFNSQSVPGPVGSASNLVPGPVGSASNEASWRMEAPVTVLQTDTETDSDHNTIPYDSPPSSDALTEP